MNGGMFPDWLMGLAAFVCIFVASHYAHRKGDYLVAAWTLPLSWLAMFYLLMFLQVDPVHDNADLRVILFRPGMFFLLLFVILHFANGRVNRAIAHLHRRAEQEFDHFRRELMRWTKLFKR